MQGKTNSVVNLTGLYCWVNRKTGSNIAYFYTLFEKPEINDIIFQQSNLSSSTNNKKPYATTIDRWVGKINSDGSIESWYNGAPSGDPYDRCPEYDIGKTWGVFRPKHV